MSGLLIAALAVLLALRAGRVEVVDRLRRGRRDARGGVLPPDRVAIQSLAHRLRSPMAVGYGRDRQSAAAAPELLEAVARELRSGGTPATALVRLAERPGLVGREAQQITDKMALGAGLEDAAAVWSREGRGPASDVFAVAGAGVSIAVRFGGRAAGPLEGLAAALRDRAEVAAEARALSAQGRLSAVVVGALPLITLAGSSAMGGGGIDVLVGSPLGRRVLVAGLALQILALVWMRRIVRVEL